MLTFINWMILEHYTALDFFNTTNKNFIHNKNNQFI